MMYRLWRYDVFRYAQNDVARFTRNDAMFALMCPQAHIIRIANIIRRSRHHLPKANIIEKSTCICKCFFLAEKERFELSRRDNRPTPLAGAPLRPLEYFSVYSSQVAVCSDLRHRLLYTIFILLSTLFLSFFNLFL